MKQSAAFARLHPGMSLLFFVCAIGGTLLFAHPLFRLCALCGALGSHAMLCAGEAKPFLLKAALPVCGFAALLNPLFNHQGVHILFYFPWGNPCTAESLLFGLSAACLLLSVLLWFRCLSVVLTSDKSVFLFSRVAPSLSLLLRLSLRFVPAFQRGLARSREAQICLLGPPGTKKEALRRAFLSLQAQLHTALTDAVAVSDAMKSRGFGLPGRTSCARYVRHRRDELFLLWLLAAALPNVGAYAAGLLRFSYFPALHGAPVSALQLICALLFFILCLTPVLLHVLEEYRWSCYNSTM